MVDYRDDPAVLIYADTGAALARMRRTAEAAGCRVIVARLLSADIDAAPGAALLIELEDEGADEAALTLLDWARQEAERGARASVVSAPAGLIDLIATRAWHPDIAHLCEADEEARVDAVAAACRKDEARVHDSRRDGDFPGLQPVNDAPFAGPELTRADAPRIRRMIRARRLRTHFFRADLFADPAWDMLLDLMAARLEGKQVAVSSLCIAAAVPPTTALRWLGVLTEHGLVVRVADRDDRRRVYVELDEETARALAAWLRQTWALEVGTA